MNIPAPFQILASVAVMAFGFVLTAQAQDPAEMEKAPAWVQHIGDQLSESLMSSADDVRHEALQHLAYFAYFYKDQLDLASALPNLLTIYEEDDDEQCRLLALAALHAIGDEEAMQEVRRFTSVALEEKPSMRVQLVTLAALMQYYGEDTFAGDEETAQLARALLEYYTGPRVIVEPPVVLDFERQ